jgi:Kae1-associated kinase Bud32
MTTQSGAEAVVTFLADSVRKDRIAKPYRHPVLDDRLRRARTKREAIVLAKAPVRVPKLLRVEKTVLEMERIDGNRLRDELNDANAAHYGAALGTMLCTLHEADIVHGDVTTSNVLVEAITNELVLIDFGLASLTKRVEDKAVDLHVLRETLSGSHPLLLDTFWNALLTTYTNAAVFERLKKVESRGRYKANY